MVKYYYDGLSVVMTREKPTGSSVWRTKKVYSLLPSAIGQVFSERENTAWTAQGQPTAWTDKWYQYDLLGNVVAQIGPSGNVLARFDQEAYGTVLSGGSAYGLHLTTKERDTRHGIVLLRGQMVRPGHRTVARAGADGGGRAQYVLGFSRRSVCVCRSRWVGFGYSARCVFVQINRSKSNCLFAGAVHTEPRVAK